MGETSENKPKNHICVGLLAHVDAGKTTLAESLLYRTGSIRKLGRVDHQDAFLDTDAMEKSRGITIFSKQAQMELGDLEITLLDTPGHVDFSAEMERTLQVLDYAILIISGADGVQGHVETLWRLLSRYRIPVFLFINKMDQEGTDAQKLMEELQSRLDARCVDFSSLAEGAAWQDGRAGGPDGGKTAVSEEFWENIAVCEEGLLERYLEGEPITVQDIAELVRERRLFPCYFGSALKLSGVDEFLQGMKDFLQAKAYPEKFGARVFKITRDEQGNRLTHMKITGGTLRVKMPLTNRREGLAEEEVWEEKADQIRLYSGAGFQAIPKAAAGCVCSVTGLTRTFAGQGLGREEKPILPILEPVLTYRIELPEGCDAHEAYLKLKQLEEEEPELSIVWQEADREIHAQVMGEVQMEILKNQIRERFGIAAKFGEGSIVYKETIENTVEGVGHFEPLRHYAEVHLFLEPLESGAGLQFAADCGEDELDRNWQRLVLTHLEEKKHRGVLIGAEITDMKITLVAGRAHLKHTEGGDFRQATYRALRQGLRKAKSVLLEPVYSFRLELPSENVGRAMTDVQKMQGSFEPPVQEGEFAILTGSAPVVSMRGYAREVMAYTKGRGRFSCTLKGYEPCHNAEEIIAAAAYDPEADLENPTGSVFCAHGAGFVVPWDEVERYMHLESRRKPEEETDGAGGAYGDAAKDSAGNHKTSGQGVSKKDRIAALPEGVSEDELEEIFTRTFGANKREKSGYKKTRILEPAVLRQRAASSSAGRTASAATANGPRPGASGSPTLSGSSDFAPNLEEYLLVDGYNIIFAWEELRELAKVNIESARNQLMDILSNYQGFQKCTLILVFDAYRVEGGQGSVTRYHNIYVVFTKEAETADAYIEKTVHKIGRKSNVTVATSDGLEQVIIYAEGARRLSARDLKEAVEQTRAQIHETVGQKRSLEKNYLFDHLPEGMTEWMEDVRLGRKKL